jgi:entericidin B
MAARLAAAAEENDPCQAGTPVGVDGLVRRRAPRLVARHTLKGSRKMLRKVVFALVAGSIALGATACNTVKGAGKDVESVGTAADKAM